MSATFIRRHQLRLDDQICFALYSASNEIVRAYRPLLGQLGLTYPQYIVMMMLWENDDVTTTDIAERLLLPVHGVIPVLQRLQGAGLVDRHPDPTDGRVVRVSLTTTGAALEARAAQVQHRVECATGLDPSTLATLRDQLTSLRQTLELADLPTQPDGH